jgi:hypothetical protein
VRALQITAAGQLKFKISQGRDWRWSNVETGQVFSGPNHEQTLFETGFKKILFKRQLSQSAGSVAFLQEHKRLLIQFVQLVIGYVIQARAFETPENTTIPEGDVSALRCQCLRQLAFVYD